MSSPIVHTVAASVPSAAEVVPLQGQDPPLLCCYSGRSISGSRTDVWAGHSGRRRLQGADTAARRVSYSPEIRPRWASLLLWSSRSGTPGQVRSAGELGANLSAVHSSIAALRSPLSTIWRVMAFPQSSWDKMQMNAIISCWAETAESIGNWYRYIEEVELSVGFSPVKLPLF